MYTEIELEVTVNFVDVENEEKLIGVFAKNNTK